LIWLLAEITRYQAGTPMTSCDCPSCVLISERASWFDTTQYRMNCPDGATALSRLIELPLAVLILILRPFFWTLVPK
jgi:hypothetical protein